MNVYIINEDIFMVSIPSPQRRKLVSPDNVGAR